MKLQEEYRDIFIIPFESHSPDSARYAYMLEIELINLWDELCT